MPKFAFILKSSWRFLKDWLKFVKILKNYGKFLGKFEGFTIFKCVTICGYF
jgi:hypothetical protein